MVNVFASNAINKISRLVYMLVVWIYIMLIRVSDFVGYKYLITRYKFLVYVLTLQVLFEFLQQN